MVAAQHVRAGMNFNGTVFAATIVCVVRERGNNSRMRHS
jgi:hypothetical protein